MHDDLIFNNSIKTRIFNQSTISRALAMDCIPPPPFLSIFFFLLITRSSSRRQRLHTVHLLEIISIFFLETSKRKRATRSIWIQWSSDWQRFSPILIVSTISCWYRAACAMDEGNVTQFDESACIRALSWMLATQYNEVEFTVGLNAICATHNYINWGIIRYRILASQKMSRCARPTHISLATYQTNVPKLLAQCTSALYAKCVSNCLETSHFVIVSHNNIARSGKTRLGTLKRASPTIVGLWTNHTLSVNFEYYHFFFFLFLFVYADERRSRDEMSPSPQHIYSH